jgi:Na+/H+ antiporter NhaA
VPLGIMAGLVIGKPAGIFVASSLAVKAAVIARDEPGPH